MNDELTPWFDAEKVPPVRSGVYLICWEGDDKTAAYYKYFSARTKLWGRVMYTTNEAAARCNRGRGIAPHYWRGLAVAPGEKP